LICDGIAGVRHDKIGELHEAGLGLADMKGVLEMLVQHIDHPVAKAPEKKSVVTSAKVIA
jgi:hypothetical protein